ncbi:hypothetical protein D918_03666 [Trichuris suis]|nr:hypothetical protein D918_03666 [Trichuris suis]
MLSDANVQVYTNILWFPCSWKTLPTFGFLENMKACVGCPLLPGINKITMRLDPSQYGFIISLVSSGVPYAVEVVARDGNHPKTELACIRVEGVIEK